MNLQSSSGPHLDHPTLDGGHAVRVGQVDDGERDPRVAPHVAGLPVGPAGADHDVITLQAHRALISAGSDIDMVLCYQRSPPVST